MSNSYEVEQILEFARLAGEERRFVEKFEWYGKAAAQGSAEAQNCLGDCYYYGIGVTQSETFAIKCYLEAANKGYVDAQFNLAELYFEKHKLEKNRGVSMAVNLMSIASVLTASAIAIPLAAGLIGIGKKAKTQEQIETANGENEEVLLMIEMYKRAADKGHQTAKERLEYLATLKY
ncbi:MAG: hypothetical protein ATN35_03425 [Epulopiscium sp. Nele67-Bin004]|nr:MAG: hypothetical protein ATN35_03425 [Epulopiscium sp. Nele67-Bin004]